MTTQLRSGFRFSRICIVQSLKRDDRKTGEELSRFLEDIEGTEGNIEFTDLSTRREFLGYLVTVRDRLQKTGEVPILHVEAHGCPEGIELGSQEFVEWSEFKEVLTEINVLSGLNFFVAMSACWGEWLVRMVRVTDRSPVWGCLGARTEISGDSLIDGFKIFYRRLLADSGVRSAIVAMGGGMHYEKRTFVLWPAEYFYLATYRGYLETECNEAAVVRRVDRIMEKSGGLPNATDEIRAALRREMEDHPRWFEGCRKTFFMEDLYPDNRNRFEVDFSTLTSVPVKDGA